MEPPAVVVPMTPDQAAEAAAAAAAAAPLVVSASRGIDQSPFEMLNAIIGNRYHLVHGIGRGKYGKVQTVRGR